MSAVSARAETPAHAPVSPSDFVLLPPPREQQRERIGMLFSEIPAYLASIVDFRTSSSSRNGSSRTGTAAAPAASGYEAFSPLDQPFLLDDWGPTPLSAPEDLDYSARTLGGRTDTATLAFARQLHAPHDALARFAFAPSAFGGLEVMARRQRPPGPPQEIDLTVSSSESESDGDASDTDDRSATSAQSAERASGDSGEGNANDDGDDGDVEILQTRAPDGGASGSPSTSARYLTYTSVPPLRRKRRRTEPTGGANPADLAMFDGQRAESTNVSLENNEVLERFKHALKCSICLDTIDELTSTICGHVYCGKCIRLAIRVTAKCPLCQRRLRPIDVHPLYF